MRVFITNKSLRTFVLLVLSFGTLLFSGALRADESRDLYDSYNNCYRMPVGPKQTDCYVKLAPRLRAGLKSPHLTFQHKLMYTKGLLDLNQKLDRHGDDDFLNDRLKVYEEAKRLNYSIEDEIGDKRSEALVKYFTALGPEYTSDVLASQERLARSRNLQLSPELVALLKEADQAASQETPASRGQRAIYKTWRFPTVTNNGVEFSITLQFIHDSLKNSDQVTQACMCSSGGRSTSAQVVVPVTVNDSSFTIVESGRRSAEEASGIPCEVSIQAATVKYSISTDGQHLTINNSQGEVILDAIDR